MRIVKQRIVAAMVATMLLLPLFSAGKITQRSAVGLPEQSQLRAGYDAPEVKARLQERGIQGLEGLWFFPDEGFTVAFERQQINSTMLNYDIVLVAADDLSLPPGTLLGLARESAARNKFDMWLYTKGEGVTLSGARHCVGTLTADEQTLEVSHSKLDVRVRVNVSRFLFPTIFRGVSVIPNKINPTAPVGFRRIFPVVNNNDRPATNVRYL